MDCKKNIKLSIIIPVYNTQQYLEKCLDSVVKAVYGIESQVEVLIINDGSTDDSVRIITQYCSQNSYMKSFNKQNGGLSDVKNYGLKHAVGEYVVFLDSDDYIEADMYRVMLQKISEENADVAVCDIRLTYDDPKKNQVYSCAVAAREGTFAQIIDMAMMPASWNKIIKKSLYSGLTFPVGLNNEDVSVTPIVLARANKIVVVPEAYYNYYQRPGSIQNAHFDERRFVILKTTGLCLERLGEIEQSKQEKIKGSLYMHQILAIALYPIRTEKFKTRYVLLKKYMEKANNMFPDLWTNSEVAESLTWEGHYMQIFRKCSYFLLRHRYYFLTGIFWSVTNIIRKITERLHQRRAVTTVSEDK